MLSEFRPIWVYADNTEIAVDKRVRVRGRSNLTLLPDFFAIDVYNLSAADESSLRNAKRLMVKVDRNAAVCSGTIEGIYSHEEQANLVTTISVSDGAEFWAATTNASFGKGASTFDVIRTIVSGKVDLGPFLCDDVRMPRGQVCTGRVAECVEMFARTLGARAFVTNDVLRIFQKGRVDNVFTINSDDVIGSPDTMDGVTIIKILGRSFSVGDVVSYGGSNKRIIARALSLDSFEGDWSIEISLADDILFTQNEMEGGW